MIGRFTGDAFVRPLESVGTAHVRNPGPSEEPRGQLNKCAIEFPDAAVLGSHHGFEREVIRVDLGGRTVGAVRDGAPYERPGATLGQPELALNDRAVVRWMK